MSNSDMIGSGMNRRGVLLGLAALPLAACTSMVADAPLDGSSLQVRRMYGDMDAGAHRLRAMNTRRVSPQFLRQEVRYNGQERAGTIVIDTTDHHLYYVLGEGRAMRYGIGVGRDGFGWSGDVKIGRKSQWPGWTPPVSMQKRDPEAAKWAAGMPGGPGNPLGARALYLYKGGRDTIYRIHGTNAPTTIGRSMSSGCIRMFNHDVVDLYERAKVGTRVIVRANPVV